MAYLSENHRCYACGTFLGAENGDGECGMCARTVVFEKFFSECHVCLVLGNLLPVCLVVPGADLDQGVRILMCYVCRTGPAAACRHEDAHYAMPLDHFRHLPTMWESKK